MESHQTSEHWFRFGGCRVALSETLPLQPVRSELYRHDLFFLHGRYGNSATWQPIIERLGGHFRCLRVDLPGFGRSRSLSGTGLALHEQAELTGELVERFSRRPVILIGHDVGGAIAQLCALQEPGLIAALVLLNTASVTHAPQGLCCGWRGWKAKRKLKHLIRACRGSSESAWESPQWRELAQSWRDTATRGAMLEAFRVWEDSWPGPVERKFWRGKLAELPRPVLVLWGKRDSLHPAELPAELMAQFRDAYLFEDEECGHWPWIERNDWVHDKLREFLFQVSYQELDNAS